jgi:type I restriction enzyme M protein
MTNFQDKVGFIWAVADLLRGDYKQSEYGKVILPLTVLRRLDSVLEKTKDAVLAKAKVLPAKADETIKDAMLRAAAGQTFYNLSKFTFKTLLDDPPQLAINLHHYITGFSPDAREIFTDKFKFSEQITRLDEANILFLVVSKFKEIDLHPDAVDNVTMGYIFEELIRKFSELSNETAGEHFTPREVIRLMVNLLFMEDDDRWHTKGIIKTLYDPAAGTGGMLSVAEHYIRDLNPDASLKTFGQELNPESFAICKSDMMIKGQDPGNVRFGNSFTQDGFPDEKFDYFLSNPPFGVEWRKVEREVRNEHETRGMSGRFGAGLPRVSDGSLLFLQHMISKFKQDGQGSRLAIVFNGSPLFTGGAGAGESEIRRWVIENDWLEAIVALPDLLFYNTGISTFIWVVTNRKSKRRKGKVQLINAASFYQKMRRSLGSKRNEIAQEQIEEITRIYGNFRVGPHCQIFNNEDFGYWRVTVERPLRLNFVVTPDRLARIKDDTLRAKVSPALATLTEVVKNRDAFAEQVKAAVKGASVTLKPAELKAVLAALGERDTTADICTDTKGNPEPDPDLRDFENVPLAEEIDAYFEREVKPHVPDAWIDTEKTKKGYEIPFTRHFYEYTPLRPLEDIRAEIESLEAEIQGMLNGALT